MQRDATQQPAGVNKEEGLRMDTSGTLQQKVTRGRGMQQQVMQQLAGIREANGRLVLILAGALFYSTESFQKT